jgi:hypothetical protein
MFEIAEDRAHIAAPASKSTCYTGHAFKAPDVCCANEWIGSDIFVRPLIWPHCTVQNFRSPKPALVVLMLCVSKATRVRQHMFCRGLTSTKSCLNGSPLVLKRSSTTYHSTKMTPATSHASVATCWLILSDSATQNHTICLVCLSDQTKR